jgi:hypothetical protein
VAFSESVLASDSLHAGQRLANPGLPGLSSNSSEQITQTFIGNDIGSPNQLVSENNKPSRWRFPNGDSRIQSQFIVKLKFVVALGLAASELLTVNTFTVTV